MIKEMIVSSTSLETKVAILEDDELAELYIERNRNRGILANTYKGKVTKVLPGMQSAFVNIGLDKDAFLYVSDFVEDNDECEQVFSAVEEQMDTVMADVEGHERPQRRERRSEKSRWREKKERSEIFRAESFRTESSRTAPSQAAQSKWIPAYPPESWDISTETEREIESHLESDAFYAPSDIPEFIFSASSVSTDEPQEPDILLPQPDEGAAEQKSGSTSHPENTSNNPDELSEEPPLNSASIKDDGETIPFTEESSKAGPVRRRSAATRRKRYTTTRQSRRTEQQSIDDVLREGQEVLVQVAKEPIGKKGARVTSHIALPGR